MTGDARPNPDALLAALQRDEAKQRRGKLKIFLGMCAGVGKTYAMLETARREITNGREVIIGYLESHGRKETDTLAAGIPLIPRHSAEYRGIQLSEFDLDAALARKPQLILVDEFAHTNAAGSRHLKRYQDIQELLNAGIDVFTTLNVQHIESRAEAVRQITGITIQETVPDSALTDADFELIDLSPDELRTRLAAGKVYLPDRAATAQDRFFRPANLAALREIALRVAAEHAGQDVLAYHHTHGMGEPWKSGQRLLCAVSSSPSSAALVRWTRRLAGELHAPWLAIYVEPARPLLEKDQARLSKNLTLARELGAEIITTTDDDIVRGVLRIAREQNVTQIIVGKTTERNWAKLFRGGSMLNQLIRESGQIDIHVVRADVEKTSRGPLLTNNFGKVDFRVYGWIAGVIALVTGLNVGLDQFAGFYAPALTYLLAVVVLALFVGRGPVLFAATLSALLWNFFFLPPRFTFYITNFQDGMMFAMYFIVALVLGQLTARIRAQQIAERLREQRATSLYLLTRELVETSDLAQLLAVVIQQAGKTFTADVALSLPEENQPLTVYFASTWLLPEKEQTIAAWAFQQRQAAGRETNNLPLSEGLHLPLIAGERIAGVLSLRFHDTTPLMPAQRDLLDAFIRQIALVLDRQRLRDTETQAQLLAESERLGTTLLNSVSHELRTPLAAISSVASGLHAAGPLNSSQKSLVEELNEATRRLNHLVQNLLDMSRLEAGHVRPNLDWHDIRDVIHAALQNLGRTMAQHDLKIDIPSNPPPVKLDAVLTEQIIVNLLGNAAVHTPAGTMVELSVRAENDFLFLKVADRGKGLPENPTHLFDRFQRGANAAAGGTGIGLSLVKGFAEAQGGSVAAGNRAAGGALFTVKLPLATMPPLPAEKE